MNYILGVINKDIDKYENIIFVDKKYKYKCISCYSDLVLRKGDKNFQSFVHKNKNGCEYFKTPTEKQLINDAKLFLRQLLYEKKVNIFRTCEICKFKIKMELLNSTSISFSSTNDIIYLHDENENIIYKFKIHNSRKCDYLLDENCFQISMLDLIQKLVVSYATQNVELLCSKSLTCNDCKEKYC